MTLSHLSAQLCPTGSGKIHAQTVTQTHGIRRIRCGKALQWVTLCLGFGALHDIATIMDYLGNRCDVGDNFPRQFLCPVLNLGLRPQTKLKLG